MKERGRFLYNRYFRDVERITMSSLQVRLIKSIMLELRFIEYVQIIFDRVRVTESLPVENWNVLPSPSISPRWAFYISMYTLLYGCMHVFYFSAAASVIIRVATKTSNRLQKVFDVISKVPLIEKVSENSNWSNHVFLHHRLNLLTNSRFSYCGHLSVAYPL